MFEIGCGTYLCQSIYISLSRKRETEEKKAKEEIKTEENVPATKKGYNYLNHSYF